MNTYEFTLVLSGVTHETLNLEDTLFEAGCDDCLINFRSGTVYLDFEREAESLQLAVVSAIKAIENNLPAKVIGIAPDNLVSESEIAKRIKKPRQTVSLWANRSRCKKNPFPSPTVGLSSERPMWRWYEVLKWLCEQNLADENDVMNAQIIEAINTAILERNETISHFRDETIKMFNSHLH